ncbi:MAG: DUF58 domain-containing protein [Planctomycetota bacterium]|nr:DUF58 domain-containing protein [Planctomycetota bacterium]
MTAAPTRFLEPALLRSIERIELRARMLVEGMYASRHRCPNYGYSVEFVDHREYVAGDEPRTIDWRMLARTEKYFVKRFEMESNMNVVCLVDASASMGYRPTDRNRFTKLEYVSHLAAAMAYLSRKQQDSPGLVLFDEVIREFIPPKQGQRHLFTILSRLEQTQARGQTALGPVLQLIAQRLNRRGLVMVLTDGYGEPESVLDGLRNLRARGHEVILFHLMDHDEVHFPFQALAAFRDLETGRQVVTDPLVQRQNYLNRFAAFRGAIEAGCAAAGIDYRFLDTSAPIETVLREYLLYRRQRAR